MSKKTDYDHWINLINSRGIAGVAARKANEKCIVERWVVNEFAETVRSTLFKDVSDIRSLDQHLNDFSMRIDGNLINIEVTELINGNILAEFADAKKIEGSPSHPLYREHIRFGPSKQWFEDKMKKLISKKEKTYSKKIAKGDIDRLDILLIFNEDLNVTLDDIGIWLIDFKLPDTDSIDAIYFQNWYHPNYLARPAWSIKRHPLLGDMRPVLLPEK